VRRALAIACVLDFVDSLPEKLDTKIGDRGVTLSGGQKQRIAIARAIFADPAVLLLDEAMSALDPESEGAVQKALDAAMVSRTTVMVSHRISTVIETAANCVVMQRGSVVEEGPPKHLLLNSNGPLRLLYEIQQRCIN
jgi:ABC-type multidrug transport system fused ATPase/permease subunit